MQTVDLRRDVSRLTVPTFFLEGANEMRGLSVLFAQWYAELPASNRHLVTIPGADHFVMFERPDQLAAVLAQAQTAAP